MTKDEIREFFENTELFLLTTHESPDGDGLGAEYALASALLDIGKDVIVLNSDPYAAKYGFIDEKNLIQTFSSDAELPDRLEERALVVLDTEPSNIGVLGPKLLGVCRRVLVIDHHSVIDTNSLDTNSPRAKNYEGWFVPDASSTCELIFRLLESMQPELKRDVAVALYTGIVYDTGSFVYPKTQAQTFRIAEKLVSSGAVPNEIYTQLFENKSTGALMLQSLVTSTMLLHQNNRVAIQVMPRETLIASGAHYDESQEIVNIPLQCADVRISVFFKENESGGRRCSMRAKGEIDCAAIAQMFNGGGHKTAAGFRFDKSFAEIQDEVLDIISLSFP